MNLWANIVAITSIVGCAFFCLRLHALKAEKIGRERAPDGASRVWMLVMAAVSGFHGQAVFFSQTVTWTESVLARASAGYAFSMWLNVRRRVVQPMRMGLTARS